MTPAETRTELEAARRPPEGALRSAVAQAAALAPAVIEILNKAADGVYLLPKQDRFLFYGLHALAAARRTELFRPLMRLLRGPSDEVERFLGDATTETMPRVVLALFDGDADPLIAAIEDPEIDGALRWGLFDALVRLTFDGAVPLDRTLATIDRFDRERLAPDDDLAWQGWQSAVLLLGLADRAERVRAAWADGRSPEREVDQRDWEERLKAVCADPANPARFLEAGLVPLDDPVAALAWMDPGEAAAAAPDPAPDRPEFPDPAAGIALDEEEIDWLAGFLEGRQAPGTAMPLEELDGFFTALVVGPELVLPSEYMPALWGTSDGEGPVYDGQEQAEYVLGLLMRHWNSIAGRLDAQYPYVPLVAADPDGRDGEAWARGFRHGIALRPEAWQPLIEDRDSYVFLGPILALGSGGQELFEGSAEPPERGELIESLPIAIIGIHLYWRDRQETGGLRPQPLRRQKIGRNEPCPCGSGRKYKRCCGSG